MPTEPIYGVLPRKLDPEIQQCLDHYAAALEEAVNYGTHIFKSCSETKCNREDIPLFLSFRHVLELGDAVSVLVRSSSVDPCKLLLRGILESYLGIEYMLKEDTKRRSMSFMVWHLHGELKASMQADPTTQQGKQFRAILKSDRFLDRTTIGEIVGARESVEHINGVLKNRDYADANIEYMRLLEERKIRKRRSKPRWYSSYGGPENLEALARNIGVSGLYETFYRYYSGATHGTDIIKGKVALDGEGKMSIVQIRLRKNVRVVTSIALSLLLGMFTAFIQRYVPERQSDYKQWYCEELQKTYQSLLSGSKE